MGEWTCVAREITTHAQTDAHRLTTTVYSMGGVWRDVAVGWAGGQSPAGPPPRVHGREFQANKNKNNVPVTVKIRTLKYQTLE